MASKIIRLAICQTKIFNSKIKNLSHIEETLEKASIKGKAKLLVLPSCFNSIYDQKTLYENAEDFSEKSPSLDLLKSLAKKHSVIIVGSIPERIKNESNKIHNTAIIIDGLAGKVFSNYKQLHTNNSDFIKPGNNIVNYETSLCNIGLGLSSDVNFAEPSIIMSKNGAQLLIFMAFNFNYYNVKKWEVSLRTRALENLAYVIGCCPVNYNNDLNNRNHDNNNGNGEINELDEKFKFSAIVDPFGRFLNRAMNKEKILYSDIDISALEEIRKKNNNKRNDIYDVIKKM